MFDLKGPAGAVSVMLDEGTSCAKDALQQGHEARPEK
jgi:hypothetical protein